MKNLLFLLFFMLSLTSVNVSANLTSKIYVADLHLGRDSSISKLMLVDRDANPNDAKSHEIKQLISALDADNEKSEINFTLPSGQQITLSPSKPHQLLSRDLADKTKAPTVIDSDVESKSIKRFERSHWFLYVQSAGQRKLLKGYNSQTGQSIKIADLIDNFAQYTITHTGYVLVTNAEQVYFTQLLLRGERIQMNDKWKPIDMPQSPCSDGFANIEVSHFANRIAIACK